MLCNAMLSHDLHPGYEQRVVFHHVIELLDVAMLRYPMTAVASHVHSITSFILYDYITISSNWV